jgi:dipeptidyl aminopeptidase/acylaminoacyl peptidase
MSDERPYGAWASAVTAASLAAGAVTLSDVRVFEGQVYWLETRPAEGGRVVVMTLSGGEVRQLTPEGFNARTRVHEYGGAPYFLAPDGLWFSNFRDQKLYRQATGAEPQAMTADGYRYADAIPLPGGGLISVREDHSDPANVRNTLVHLSGQAGEAGEVLFDDSDFVAYPRLSPDGRRLAWVAWDFPAMPWDATRLYVADLGDAGLDRSRIVAGGPGISVLEPRWAADGTLTWLSDESGFWNLYDDHGGARRAILPRDAEFGGPPWSFGRSNYAVVGGKIVAAVRGSSGESLLLIDRTAGTATALSIPYALSFVQALDAKRIVAVGQSPTSPGALVMVDVTTGGVEVAREASEAVLPRRDIAVAERIQFSGAGGETTHALFYPPTNADFHAPAGEKPPLIVQAHGGPTSAASSALNLGVQYWTSRGFAVVDVDYGGSTGYGRAYRERLKGAWGVVDVDDVIAAARFLADGGRVDAKRLAIHGSSAGGFTVLAALARSDVFAAGGDFYGVADLSVLAREAHKFESRYMDSLVGPWPAAAATYRARSPINDLDRFASPLLILQGAEDPIVPPNQARMIRDALRARGVPVACIEFEGEGHGFRRAENITRAKEVELYFYSRVFGFELAEPIAAVEIENLPA